MLLLRQSPMGQPNDIMTLEILKGSLDEISRLRLQARRERDPSITFVRFWQELERTHVRDVADRYRQEWERLSVSHLPRLTLMELRKFHAKFEIALGRVEDASEEEIAKKFLQALPQKVRKTFCKKHQNEPTASIGCAQQNHALPVGTSYEDSCPFF